MRELLRALFVVLLLAASAAAQDGGTDLGDLTLSQHATAEDLITISYPNSFTVYIDPTSTGCVCIQRRPVGSTCEDLTTCTGKPLCRKEGRGEPLGWVFNTRIDGTNAPLCVIAEADSDGIILKRTWE